MLRWSPKDRTDKTDNLKLENRDPEKRSPSKKSHDSKRTPDKKVISQKHKRRSHRRSSSNATAIYRGNENSSPSSKPTTPLRDIKLSARNSNSPEYFSTPASIKENGTFESDFAESPKRVSFWENSLKKNESLENETHKKNHSKDRRSSLIKRENSFQDKNHSDDQQNHVESWIEETSTAGQTSQIKYLIGSIFSALSLVTFFFFSSKKTKAKKQIK